MPSVFWRHHTQTQLSDTQKMSDSFVVPTVPVSRDPDPVADNVPSTSTGTRSLPTRDNKDSTSTSRKRKLDDHDGSHPTGNCKRYERRSSASNLSNETESAVSGSDQRDSSSPAYCTRPKRTQKGKSSLRSNTKGKPDVIIYKRSNAEEGPKSLHGIYGVRLFDSPILKSEVCKIPKLPDLLFSSTPTELLNKIENSKIFQDMKKVIEVQLGNLEFIEKSKYDGRWDISKKDAAATDLCDKIAYTYNIDCEALTEGYTSGMLNGKGRDSLVEILKMCSLVAKEQLLQHAENGIIVVKNIGSRRYHRDAQKSDPSCFIYNDNNYVNVRDGDDDASIIDGIKHDDAESDFLVGNKECNPDVAVFLRKCGSQEFSDRHYAFIGEVKYFAESNRTNSCPTQAWIQSLIGLKTLNETYGILCEATKMTLYKLHKDDYSEEDPIESVKTLKTFYRKWHLRDLVDHEETSHTYRFDTDNLLAFMKTVICIMYNIAKSKFG